MKYKDLLSSVIMDIGEILENRSNIVNKVIEKYLPRKYDANSMIWTFGTPRYKFNPELASETLPKPVWELLDRGGKRWRPIVFMMLCEAMSTKPEKFLDFVVIIELVHNGSLIVDDVEDDSDLRRGKPTLNKIFGIDIAINAGNFLYYLPLLVLLKNECQLPKEKLLKAYEIYGQELINIHLGQGMDIGWHRGLSAEIPSEKEYMQMCAFKTGTLARLAARLAVLVSMDISDARFNIEEKAGRFAESIGVAFQIQDDILNITAKNDKGQFTKDYMGSDITEGKKSLPVIRTLGVAKEKDKIRLIDILNMHTRDRLLIDEAIGIIQNYDSINYSKGIAANLVKDAWHDMNNILKTSQAKNDLEALVKFLVNREY